MEWFYFTGRSSIKVLMLTCSFKKILYKIKIEDRARWGASGALLPTIRYSGVEFPVEAALFLDSVLVSGVEG